MGPRSLSGAGTRENVLLEVRQVVGRKQSLSTCTFRSGSSTFPFCTMFPPAGKGAPGVGSRECISWQLPARARKPSGEASGQTSGAPVSPPLVTHIPKPGTRDKTCTCLHLRGERPVCSCTPPRRSLASGNSRGLGEGPQPTSHAALSLSPLSWSPGIDRPRTGALSSVCGRGITASLRTPSPHTPVGPSL